FPRRTSIMPSFQKCLLVGLQGGIKRTRIIDVSVVLGANIDGLDERLNLQNDILVEGCERHWNRLKWLGAISRPHGAERRLLLSRHQHIIRTVRPSVLHGHSLASAQQVDLHKVRDSFHETAALPQVLPPTL